MSWPPYSPDLNPIENLWGILVQRVYANGRQFPTVDQLKECIILEWNNIEIGVIQELSLSMNNRLFNVAFKQGGNIDY